MVAGRALEIVRRAGSEQRPIVRLQGVQDRDAAEALRGQELTVAGADAPALEEGEWWAHELEGCRVIDGARSVGIVTRLMELPSCEALEIQVQTGGQTGESGSLLVPMVKDAIRTVDVQARVIDVNMRFIEE